MAKQQAVDEAFAAGNINAPTGVETAAITSPQVSTPLEVNHVLIHFACLVSNPDASASYSVKLHRGNSVAAPLAFTTPALGLGAAANATVPLAIDFSEYLSGTDFAQYTASILQAAVAGTSVISNPSIRVESL